jgi:hypothetical protein
VFKRLAAPGEQDDEDWRETVYEKVLADGVLDREKREQNSAHSIYGGRPSLWLL